ATPGPPGRWLTGKVIGAGVLAVPVVLLAAVVLVSIRPLAPDVLWRSASVVAGALTLSLSSGVWAGLVFGDPEWINPRAMLKLSRRPPTPALLPLQIGLWVRFFALL